MKLFNTDQYHREELSAMTGLSFSSLWRYKNLNQAVPLAAVTAMLKTQNVRSVEALFELLELDLKSFPEIQRQLKLERQRLELERQKIEWLQHLNKGE